MKKLPFIILLFILPFVFSSCKKDSSNGPPAISISINDTTTSFNYLPSATLTTYGATSYNLVITAFKGPSTLSDRMVIELQSTTPITTGTYSEFDAANSAMILDDVYRSVLDHKFYQAFAASANADPAIVNITSIDGNSVKGTFKGTLTFLGAGGSDKKVLTNGVFDASF